MDSTVIGALIALGGVAVGSIIQIVLRLSETLTSRVLRIRSEVSAFAAETHGYLAATYQLIDELQQYPDNAPYPPHIHVLIDEVNRSYPLVQLRALNLSGCGEPEVEQIGNRLHGMLNNFSETYAGRIAADAHLVNLEELQADKLAINRDLTILLNMVESRWFERIPIFRSEKRAARILDEYVKKQGESDAAA